MYAEHFESELVVQLTHVAKETIWHTMSLFITQLPTSYYSNYFAPFVTGESKNCVRVASSGVSLPPSPPPR
jgi:hypothetical protein